MQPTLATPGYEGFQYAQTMSSFPPAAHDVFRFDELLTQEERDIRYRTRAFMVCLQLAPCCCHSCFDKCSALASVTCPMPAQQANVWHPSRRWLL